MSNENKYSDIAALESVAYAKNYNKYIFKLISRHIQGSEVLDFGAGYGNFCSYLKNKNKNVTAIEINEEAIERLNELLIFSLTEIGTKFEKYWFNQIKNRTNDLDNRLGLNLSFISFWSDKSRDVLTTFFAFEENQRVRTIIKPDAKRKIVGVDTLLESTSILNSSAAIPELNHAS